MTYSFTKAQKRPLFNLFTKLWLALFVLSIVFIVLLCFVYNAKSKLSQDATEEIKQQIVLVQTQIIKKDMLYTNLFEQSQLSLNFNKNNKAFKDSLRNLFNIVERTDGITLDSVEQDKNSLKITGVSPTKEMFTLLLETPLKSIFDETKTSYEELDNGWYRFTSISTKQILEENDER